MVCFGEEMSEFRLCCEHFSVTEIEAYFENF